MGEVLEVFVEEKLSFVHRYVAKLWATLIARDFVAYPTCATCAEHFEWCGAGQTLASLLMARAMYHTYACLLEAQVKR